MPGSVTPSVHLINISPLIIKLGIGIVSPHPIKPTNISVSMPPTQAVFAKTLKHQDELSQQQARHSLLIFITQQVWLADFFNLITFFRQFIIPTVVITI